MKSPIKKGAVISLSGIVIGFLNGLLGVGGGMVAVPLLRFLGLSDRESHATSILIILLLSVISVLTYLDSGSFSLSDAVLFLPGGVLGAVLGAVFLKKFSTRWLHIIFGTLVIFAAIRLWFL